MLHKRNRRLIHAIVNLGQNAMGRIIRMKGATEFAYDSLGLWVPAIVRQAFLMTNPAAPFDEFRCLAQARDR
ncbi:MULTISPECIES: hypothetical protein [Mesorhizobium]|jgi:hypothetical protein|uniref:hypothetical protein n=1 Tax=Mesorhizobium TaxID=68287 RepID=UPI00047F0153|nr:MULTISPECIES: hypothetical protein [Mesorhizobium]RWQ60347.1 MAG: hypothetical protein EOS83_07665 [Mesorhizobium sp.]